MAMITAVITTIIAKVVIPTRKRILTPADESLDFMRHRWLALRMAKKLQMIKVTSQPASDQGPSVADTDVPKMANSGASSRLMINCSVGFRSPLNLEFIIEVVVTRPDRFWSHLRNEAALLSKTTLQAGWFVNLSGL